MEFRGYELVFIQPKPFLAVSEILYSVCSRNLIFERTGEYFNKRYIGRGNLHESFFSRILNNSYYVFTFNGSTFNDRKITISLFRSKKNQDLADRLEIKLDPPSPVWSNKEENIIKKIFDDINEEVKNIK